MNGDKIDSIDFIPRSRTFSCEEERKPLIIDSQLFKTILNEVKKHGVARIVINNIIKQQMNKT